MSQVFISYSRKDLSFVKQLAADLEKAGLDVWFDLSDLDGGSRWRIEIEKAIKSSQYVIVVLSPHSIASEWVDREFLFSSKHKRKIIPLMYRECDLTLNYLNLNYIDVQGQNYQMNFNEILAALDRQPARTGDANVHTGPVPLKKPTPPAAVFGLILIVIALVIGVGFWALPPAGPTPLVETTVPATLVPVSPSSTATRTLTSAPTATSTPKTPVLPPETSTHMATVTATAVSPVPLGEDWSQGCISTLWKPYPQDIPVIEKGNGCWKEPVHVFSAENGDLDFLAERRRGSAEVYGLFAELPEDGTVTVRIQLKDLSNVDLWMGVFAEQDIDSQGLLMVIPAGNVRKRVFMQKDPVTYEMLAGTDLLEQGNSFSITFHFTANSARCTISSNFFFTKSVPIPSSQKWLFLGYKGLTGSYRVQGRFFNFVIGE